MEIKKYAANDSDKKLKYQHIINTAERLLSDADFHRITMASLAEQAGLAKGTLFIYFQSKEDVFLSLAEQKIIQWSHIFSKNLKAVAEKKGQIQINELIDILLDSIKDKVFIKLFTLLDDTLERNIDYKRAFRFKSFIKGKMTEAGNMIEAVLPIIHKGDGIKLLNHFFICLIGAYKTSDISPIVKQVAQQPGFEMFDRDFIKTLRDMLTYHMIGFLTIN